MRGFAQPWIILLLMQQPCHGYELLERFGHEDLPCVDPGMLYRMLRNLESEGMVRSSWETAGGGPARRRYEVTGAGVELVHAWAAQVRATRHRLDRFLEDYAAQFEEADSGAAPVVSANLDCNAVAGQPRTAADSSAPLPASR